VTLAEWVKKAPPGERWVLSLSEGTQSLGQMLGAGPVTVLSGPEGGLSPSEELAALAAGFAPVTLGPRVLRAETAPLAVLAACSV
jgi:16S rRNA (uracil1498-N3)-methyltransferase